MSVRLKKPDHGARFLVLVLVISCVVILLVGLIFWGLVAEPTPQSVPLSPAQKIEALNADLGLLAPGTPAYTHVQTQIRNLQTKIQGQQSTPPPVP